MDGQSFPLRNRCRCGAQPQSAGIIRVVNGQNTVRCAACGAFNGFNAPKTETGEATRAVTRREGIKPARRASVLMRDGFRCQLCGAGADSKVLNVGHVLSVADAAEMGIDPEVYDHDENLITECEECNLGHGSLSLRARDLIRLLIKRRCA